MGCTHPLSDLSDVLSVLPAGEHVGEGERLQTGVDQICFGRLLLILFCGSKQWFYQGEFMFIIFNLTDLF